MANEMKHKDPGVVDLTYVEYTAIDAHEADGQTANDMWYFNGVTSLWERGTPSTILTLLTAQAGAAFSFNDQQLNAVKQIQYTAPTELTLDTDGILTVTQAFHTVDTYGNASSDDLVTINGGTAGMIIFLRAENDARTIVVKHNTGNIWLPGALDISLDDIRDGILLAYDGTKWIGMEVALTAHVAAADPHTGYRLESADHTHQSTGMQAGQLDHGLALTGLTDDDHPQYLKESEYTAADTVLVGTGAGTLGAVTLAASQFLAKKATGVVTNVTATEARAILNVEDGADVTDATNVAAAGAVMEADTSTASMSFVVDEDDMASNLATKVPTQQSVKAYVDSNGGGIDKGALFPATAAVGDYFHRTDNGKLYKCTEAY